ncbi:hypothetical protein SAMN02745704_02217 [Paucidesulfovibrio gracilis DSM 16080]|uniref:Uncharacterized protein n=1 Tax=Paucidesulfovibrio gracilis DSM 16080 TaxID=1121449 RepID=A0A1T4XMT8_9BACT|nr:hypothetical protein [Paucidesulfovibrio gracilis]SKA90405.1 hypothetical protein SAMN02745704_02217 [Paucidesulfovibrio gracilis DSM 16080]
MRGILLGLALVVLLVGTSWAGQRYSVRASVAHGSGAIHAKLVPGEFEVPAGKTAMNLKCFRTDPASGWTSDKLCSVYSVTQGVDMKDANGNPLTQLPPGVYRFAVGGKPGAYGTFSYELVP